MSGILSSGRGKSWVFQVTVLCIILGMLLALSLKTQREARKNNIPGRTTALSAEFGNLKKQNADLLKEKVEYQGRYEKLAKQISSGQGKGEAVEEALSTARMLAGTVPVYGRGLVITLQDSPQLSKSETRKDVIEDNLVHDYDIREVINELYAAGAEAIAVNDQRLVTTSSVRCAGPVILVNTRRIAPPYVVRAIGVPETLKGALQMQGSPVEMLFLLDMIKIEKSDNVKVPAYKGSTRFEDAHPEKARA